MVLKDVELSFTNPFGNTTMLGYNHRHKASMQGVRRYAVGRGLGNISPHRTPRWGIGSMHELTTYGSSTLG